MRFLKFTHLLPLVCALATTLAHAGVGSGDIATSVTLNNDCVLSANSFSFGTSSTLQPANVNANTTIQVQCTSGTPYTIALTGVHDGAVTNGAALYNHGLMSTTQNVSNHPYYLPYTTTQDAAGNVMWGSTVGTNTVSGVGTGVAVQTTVYGHLTASSGIYLSGRLYAAKPDTYTDTITVSLQY